MIAAAITLNNVAAATPRIGEIEYRRDAVPTIKVRPGLAAIIEFPKPIFEVHFGNTKNIKSIISQVYPRQLTIFVTTADASPTNLIVKCEKKTYVLDIVPSRTDHQDFTHLGSGANYNTVEAKSVSLSPRAQSKTEGAHEEVEVLK